MDSSYEESPRGDSNIKDFATKRSQQIVNMSTVLASTMSKQNPNLRSTHITGRPLYKDNSDVDDSDDENVTTAQGHTSYSIDPTNLNTAHKFQNQKNNHATNSTVITSSTVSKKHADKNHRRISQESNCSNYQARVGTNYMMHQTNEFKFQRITNRQHLLGHDSIVLRPPYDNVLKRERKEHCQQREKDHKDQGKGHHCFNDGLW